MNNDLISRDALKSALKSNCKPEICHDYGTNWCEACCPHNDFEDLIDNAPTVNPSLNLDNITKEDIEKFKTIWQRATSKGLPTFIEDRTQGEWISSYRECKCSICNFKTVVDTYRYCPNCGADMRGGAE